MLNKFYTMKSLRLFEKGRFLLMIKDTSPLKKRYICMTHALCKTIPTKSKSSSSHEWLTRQLNDQYCIRSRYDNYRCRSAYKLLEIDDKYHILKPGMSVVDCGAAPGSWTQIVVKKLRLNEEPTDDSEVKGVAIAVDLQNMQNIQGAIVIKESDFTHASVQDKIWSYLPNKKADVILSDMAPKASGTHDLDSTALLNLVYTALKFSVLTLKEDGTFLCKVWDGIDLKKLTSTLGNLFSFVKRVKPKSSRMDSAELYILAKGFKSEKFVK